MAVQALGTRGASTARLAGSHVWLTAVFAAGAVAVALAGAQLVRSDNAVSVAAQPATLDQTAATSLQAASSSAVGATERRYAVTRRDGALTAHTHGLDTRFASTGVTIAAGADTVRLGIAAAAPVAHGNQVSYAHAGMSEWYRNGPAGLEQGFTVNQPPANGSQLKLDIPTSGTLQPELHDGRIVFSRTSTSGLTYGGLTAVDTTGRALSATLGLDGRTITLNVDAAGARYPVTIDPLIQNGSKLTATGATAQAAFGDSVALSADGSTAIVGAPFDTTGKGAAFVFTRSGSTWTQQGAKLVPSDIDTASQFGSSVALSADGNTALIGAPQDSEQSGEAWVFIRTGSTWTQQGPKFAFPGENGGAAAGTGVALSADGNTAAVGGPDDNLDLGAAWIFTRSGTTWTAQGAKLTGIVDEYADGKFGSSIDLSADGNTVLIGGSADDGGFGAGWVFTRSGSTWTQQGGKLVPTGGTGSPAAGASVALSSDGNTALIGGPEDLSSNGAAWVFTRSGPTWTQQMKLTGALGSGLPNFGISVALSGDGNTALVGGDEDNAQVGAAWMFTRSGTSWSPLGAKFTGSGGVGPMGPEFGGAVALATDGNSAFIGGSADNGDTGAVWAYGPSNALSGAGHTVAAVQNGPAVGIEPAVTVTDSGSANFTSATVSIGGFSAGDVLAATTTGTSISAGYAAGTLSLTGTDTLAHYQQVLRTVTFASSSGTAGSRTINWIANDGTTSSYPVTSTVTYATVPVATVPGAPSITLVTAGDGTATVSFSGPASNGGSAVTSYTVTSAPGGITANGSASPITVTGLSNKQAYTFTVKATNAVGTGPASAPSVSVIPQSATIVVINQSVGGISLGETETDVEKGLGPPNKTIKATLGSGKTGKIATYTSHGKPVIIIYDSTGHVVSIQAFASAYQTSGGVGPGSTLASAKALKGFHQDFCSLGYWNGPAKPKPGTVITAFTPGNGGAINSVLITQFQFDSACAGGSKENPPGGSSTVVVGKSIGGVSIGATETSVEATYGKPKSHFSMSLGSGKPGKFAKYKKNGIVLLVEYDATGHVVSLETSSPLFRTAGKVGPGSDLTLAAKLHGFHYDYCSLGYWNGTGHTRPTTVVTVFTPAGTVVGTVIITQLRLYTLCASGSKEIPPSP